MSPPIVGEDAIARVEKGLVRWREPVLIGNAPRGGVERVVVEHEGLLAQLSRLAQHLTVPDADTDPDQTALLIGSLAQLCDVCRRFGEAWL